jgi:endo-1,4-beta-mannosidase
MDGIKTFYVNISNNKIIKIEDIIFKNNTGILLFKTTKDIDKELIKIIKQYGKDLSSLHSFQEIKSKIMNIIKNWYYNKYHKIIDNCLLTKILN